MTSEKAFEQKKDLLMNQIIESGYFKAEDGRHLYELNLSELEQTHHNLQNQKVREV
ncbi:MULTISPECIES: Fur-regulated basic protein FbpA [Priestia]|uniref:Fur-regulated basic protein FbpA n=1 Tax=Priestia TaxID=2800373 RepID=UPI000428E69F|nr:MULTISPECIES: Fur-regulated basic protein FbpA [Priestia]MBK0004900.1 Fur-regulated basic protein FbpA [Bacillus sp. S35]SDD73039.1 Fur-regulated basic protein A [Priestia aryabhattai B8W22]MCM3253067.1 Fur-regulated basic protein FbpA [Priestia aryabhattai]MCM3641296.1 Fur-regulated basic protein FbpA [Priestia aryabhattai]PFW71817.1 Fur-regulated basic protein FbpA [Priestia aryabhattai]